MNKKYELLTDDTVEVLGTKLYRIKALKSFGDVKKGDLGGYIESESNLSHYNTCWVYDDAKVSDNAWVLGKAKVSNEAHVYGNAWVYGNARISGNAKVHGKAKVRGEDHIFKGELK